MRARLLRRLIAGALLAALFGALWSILKGNGGGIRDTAGNLSAPWVILPLLAGALVARGRAVLGAVVGVAGTWLALCAFYLTNTFVLDLGPHSTLGDLALTMGAVGNLWFRYGLVSGIALGGVGAWLAERGSLRTVGLVAAALLVLEPAALALGRTLALSGLGPDPLVSVAEVGCGLALATALLRRRGRTVPDGARPARERDTAPRR